MLKKTELDKLAEKYRPTKIIHDYFRYYWRHFVPIRDEAKSILEIGIQQGRSLLLWKEFFPGAQIYGVDVDASCKEFEKKGIGVFIGDSTQPSAAQDAVTHFGVEGFDVIIDDGAHDYQSQIRTFLTWFPYLREGGIYVVEDVAQFPGYDRLGAVEAFSELIYGVNFFPKETAHWRSLTTFDECTSDLVRKVCGVSFYRYIIFIDKGRNPEGNRYLSDPAFNRLDIEAQDEQNGVPKGGSATEHPIGAMRSTGRAISRLLDLVRYRWRKQYFVGRVGKLGFLEFLLWRLRVRRTKE
jgi:hypothetical protein